MACSGTMHRAVHGISILFPFHLQILMNVQWLLMTVMIMKTLFVSTPLEALDVIACLDT